MAASTLLAGSRDRGRVGWTMGTEMTDNARKDELRKPPAVLVDRPRQTRFSFGATSAIITNLGIITGLDTLTNPKMSIIGALLVIAVADNLSDSFGIHFYQESEHVHKREVWLSTLTNFFTRLLVSSTFVALIAILPVKLAVVCSIIWGLLVLAVITYLVAKQAKTNPYSAVLVHLAIAVLVVAAGHIVGGLVIGRFQS
jgi:VIT1/CCC1 family predicted Fe2+/Mn2+ transporter